MDRQEVEAAADPGAGPEVMRLTGAGGISLAADAYGQPGSPPVLLFHGGGQTRHSWHTTARTLGARGWRALSVDLRGHGESDWPDDGDYGLDAFAGDVLGIISEMDRPPALVGASLGGVATLVAVGESTKDLASALVLVDIAHRIESEGSQRIGDFMRERMEDGFGSVEEAAAAVAAYNPHRPPPSNLSGLKRNLRRRPDGRWVWHWDPRFLSGQGGSIDETRVSLLPPERLEAAARAVRVPTLLVRGRMSDVLSPEGARQFLDLVPHAEFVDVAGAGHMVAGDRNDIFNEAIVQFLDPVRPD
jgi:pimeloyl-ACP methyl ester carboxylesterase